MIHTDFHSHILPGVDDGSTCVEESLQMLRLEAEHGVQRVIATPHFYPRYDTPERFFARRDRAMAELQEAMAKEEGLPEITLGAEVYFFPGMSESDVLNRLTIGAGAHILVEMPFGNWTPEMYRELENIRVRRGIVPIVAHVDRYIRPFHTHGIPKRLAEVPVLVQANTEFFLDRSTSSMAMRMLKADMIHFVGTDCHNLTTRKPNMDQALQKIQKKLDQSVLDRLEEYEQSFWNL
jgi:protein-tyrosine phosphatase